MDTTERLTELVALSKRLKSLAYELDLDLIGLMADMVLVESTQTLYMALEEDEELPPALPHLEGTRRALVHGSPLAQPSNVTQLGWYRDRKRAG